MLASVEASIVALYVLSTPGLDAKAYSEDVLEAAVELTKYYLLYNVYAFREARFRTLYRPQLFGGARFGTITTHSCQSRCLNQLLMLWCAPRTVQ